MLLDRSLQLQQPLLRNHLLVLTKLGEMGDSCAEQRRRLIYYGDVQPEAESCTVASTRHGLFAALRDADPTVERHDNRRSETDYLHMYVMVKVRLRSPPYTHNRPPARQCVDAECARC